MTESLPATVFVMDEVVSVQTHSERTGIESFDTEFERLHARSCKLIETTPFEILYGDSHANSDSASVGAFVLRSAAVESGSTGPSDLPLLAAQRSDNPGKSGLEHRHHVHSAECGVRQSGGDYGLVQPLRAEFGSVGHLEIELLFTAVMAEVREAAAKAKIERYDKEDLKVRAYGDTAVTSYRIAAKAQFEETEINRQFCMTNVWMKREGRWQIVARHTANLEREKDL